MKKCTKKINVLTYFTIWLNCEIGYTGIMNNKEWVRVFKALANPNRLMIIRMLADGRERHVTTISSEIHVTMSGTSRHLRQLTNLDILLESGKANHVFYSLNPSMLPETKKAVELFLKSH